MSDEALLEVKELTKHFPIKSGGIVSRTVGEVQAVDGVSFSVQRSETLGLVGESGCGKSTTARLILRLIEATSGEVTFDGKPVLDLNKKDLRRLRRDMQIVFQDPYASLNPRMTVRDIIGEGPKVWGLDEKLDELVGETMARVGLNPDWAKRYPLEFSGGQRQRIGIARALIMNPTLLLLDEPVSALDVSIQAGVINLLDDLQAELDLAYIFIAHDLSVVRHMSDRVAVMYLGKLVELADRNTVYERPAHPYTHSLLAAAPVADPEVERTRTRIVLQGDPPSPANPPAGCRFHTRCPIAQDICKAEEPELKTLGPGHQVACHFPLEAGQQLAEVAVSLGREVHTTSTTLP